MVVFLELQHKNWHHLCRTLADLHAKKLINASLLDLAAAGCFLVMFAKCTGNGDWPSGKQSIQTDHAGRLDLSCSRGLSLHQAQRA